MFYENNVRIVEKLIIEYCYIILYCFLNNGIEDLGGILMVILNFKVIYLF